MRRPAGPSTCGAEVANTGNRSRILLPCESSEENSTYIKTRNTVDESKSKVNYCKIYFLKVLFSYVNYLRKRKLPLRWRQWRIPVGRNNVRIVWIFWIGRKIRFRSANLSIRSMCLTTCVSLIIQWTCKLLVNNFKTIITQHLPSSPRTSVSSLKIPRNLTATQNRWFTWWLIASWSCLKITSAPSSLPVKLRRQQLDESLNFSVLSTYNSIVKGKDPQGSWTMNKSFVSCLCKTLLNQKYTWKYLVTKVFCYYSIRFLFPFLNCNFLKFILLDIDRPYYGVAFCESYLSFCKIADLVSLKRFPTFSAAPF